MIPRTFSVRVPFLLAVTTLLPPAMQAQQTADKTVSQPPAAALSAQPATKTKRASAAAKAKADQQQALALSLLVSLANEARSFSDQKLRARTLSRTADALWEPDPEQGRALFRKAWDAAEVGDQESARRTEEERRRQQAGDPKAPFALAQPADLRAEVLRLAAKRDRALGEELLDKLKEAKRQEATDASFQAPNSRSNRAKR